MKRRIGQTICIVLALALLASLFPAAFAIETRGSDYFAAHSIAAYANGGGEILIEFDIAATHKMDELGATALEIYEQQSNGKYICVYTFMRDDDGMMFTNDYFANGAITYQGTSGVKYYAKAKLYCKDKDGSQTILRTSNVVTA